LFLIFINDMPDYLQSLVTKLFADDITLIFVGDDLDSVISEYKLGINLLIDWCKHNKLDINWSKTYIMFIFNKRLKFPKLIEFSGAMVDVVDTFKLLGLLIDCKLTFLPFVTQQCISINRKLYAIKRLFYLPYDTKLQFFKSFILPYFDYGITLSIYLHKLAIRKLCKV
jgi:hypothetical protein